MSFFKAGGAHWRRLLHSCGSLEFVGAAALGIAARRSIRSERFYPQSVQWTMNPLMMKTSQCCGIIGYLGTKDTEPVLTQGLEVLQTRGYDSCGISTISPKGKIVTTKFANKHSAFDSLKKLVDEAPKHHKGHHIGIAHTRWATHGGKTDANAHPHQDYKDRIAVIHNGTIFNYAELKQLCTLAGIPFKSETDTEVISNLIGMNLDKGLDFEAAVTAAVQMLRGTWGLAIIHRDHRDRMILARNGSPLIVGSAENQVFVASEPEALANYTKQFLSLKDGEIVVITSEGIDHLLKTRSMQKIPDLAVETSPAPYPHWTLKEIMEQPQSLARALNYGGRILANGRVKLGGLDANKETILGIKQMLLAGCGTSLYASLYGQLLMETLGCFENVKVVDASEVNTHCAPHATGILLTSQSGESTDLIRACQIADDMNMRKISVVNTVGSLLARMTNCGVYLNAGKEMGVASTKAFTSQVTCLALIASWFAQHQTNNKAVHDKRRDLMDAVQRLPVYAGMTLQCNDQCKKIAAGLKDARSMFILGKGFAYPVALEGALKIKETSYIHAEGFAGSALKHGPFALLDASEQTPVVMICLADEHEPGMINAMHEVKARGARVVCITDNPEKVQALADFVIPIPSNGPLTALLAAIPIQCLAYHLALAKNLDVDKPRNISKVVLTPTHLPAPASKKGRAVA